VSIDVNVVCNLVIIVVLSSMHHLHHWEQRAKNSIIDERSAPVTIISDSSKVKSSITEGKLHLFAYCYPLHSPVCA
jgi:hypothetical protein